MKVTLTLLLVSLGLTAAMSFTPTRTVSGDYLEVRSCDVYTGSCVANSEMGIGGREGMLIWSVAKGMWNGVKIDGLRVVAVVHTDDTLGDVRYHPRKGRAVLLVDERADASQHAALLALARDRAGSLIDEVVAVKSVPIEVTLGECRAGSCASVKAGSLVEISTRCLGGKDHLCGNEENFYPPLSAGVIDPVTAYTELASFKGSDLKLTWELTAKRSAYLGRFSL